jgi:hypothetical protein
MMIDLTGRVFNQLTAVGFLRDLKGRAAWICSCACGDITTVLASNLTRRKSGTKSCGCTNKYKTKDPGVSAKRSVLSRYKFSARERDFEWGLSDVDFECLTQSACQYCGCAPAMVSTNPGDNGSFVYNGIDRVNNTKGYVLGNVVPCCQKCNQAKLTYSVSDFLTWARRVVQFNEVK